MTLQDYLDEAYHLHPTYNIFISTDDEPWLESEMKQVSSNWKIFSVAGSSNSRNSSDTIHATEYGVQFFSSLAFIRQCQAFVGHWGSAVSHLYYHYMCLSHDLNVDICPPAVNIGGLNKWASLVK